MNWEAIGGIGEIAGALGVIISLVYLATQIRQNSAWLKSTVMESAGTRMRDLTSSVYSDSDLSRIMSVGFSQNVESLTLEEKQRFALVMTSSMRGHEINFVHYKSGMLDEESYQAFVQNMTVFTSSPLFDEWWKISAQTYRKDFCEKVEEVRKTIEGTIYDPYKD